MARVARVEYHTVGSELEALLREAMLIRELQPIANVQIGNPALRTRAIPRALVRDVVILAPSVDAESAELVAARVDGDVMMQRARRDASETEALPRVSQGFSVWPARLHGRSNFRLPRSSSHGLPAAAVRPLASIPHDGADLSLRLAALLKDKALFAERLITI